MRTTNIPDTQAMDRQIAPNPGRRAWKIALGVLLIIVAALVVRPLLARWSNVDRSIERARLRIAEVTRGELRYEVAVQGRVVAASRPTLFATASGLIVLHVREGEAVQAGQVLAELESPELASRQQQEEATYAALDSEVGRLQLAIRQQNQADAQRVELLAVKVQAAERGLKRAEKLNTSGLLNDLDLEAARDELTIQNLELSQAQRNQTLQSEMRKFELDDAGARRDRQGLVVQEIKRQVDELIIRAPFNGLIATLDVENRDAVNDGQALLGIVDLNDLEVAINIPEAYADEVTPGLNATVQIGSDIHTGIVTQVAPEVRNSQVEGRLSFSEGTPEGLRQNQRLSTRVILDQRPDTIKVARGPWLDSGAGRTAWVVHDDVARSREVTIGAVSVTEVEVLSGLEPGEQIILSDLSRFDGSESLLLRD